jgi:fructuronate reductase
VRSGSDVSTRVIGAVLDVLDASTQRDDLLRKMSDPRVRIVSLTITEKGYCYNPATGELDLSHPDIVHDLAHPKAPISAPGLLVRALELRRVAGIAPFTVLCCDNLPSNGRTTRRVVTNLACLRERGLGAWVESEVAFPSSMVDRIVPATTESDRTAILEATGYWDAWPVVTEPFTQWVIEDQFPQGRPPLETAGVQLVSDVGAHEVMKLRMLNGSHSTLAYLGYLAGYELVSQAIANPSLRKLIHGLMTNEVISTLPAEIGNYGAYRDALLERFANPALKHRTWQIAMDGSQKLPQRLLGTIRCRLDRGQSITLTALGVAAWMRYVTGIDERGRDIDVRDPLAARLKAITQASSGAPDKLLDGFLGLSEMFGPDLTQNPIFRATLAGHLALLFERGALATVESVI